MSLYSIHVREGPAIFKQKSKYSPYPNFLSSSTRHAVSKCDSHVKEADPLDLAASVFRLLAPGGVK